MVRRAFWISLLFFCLPFLTGKAETLDFTFNLDERATTSAGVYRPDGTLVRTLWRKVEYRPGTHTGTWDGKNDAQQPVPIDTYAVRLISHRANYVWEGGIGNTSTAPFGRTVHRGFGPVTDLTITGNDAFYITGYTEGDYDFRHFLTNDPQRVNDRWCWYWNAAEKKIENRSSTIYSPEWNATDSDDEWVYFASPWSTDPVTRELRGGPGFVVAAKVSTRESASFEQGCIIENGPAGFFPFANGIRVGQNPGLSGLAVQKDGDFLAVSVRPDHKIYLLHKRTGATLGEINLPSPGACGFTPNGDLWVLSNNTLVKIVSPGTKPTFITVATDLSSPIDLATAKDGSLVAVIDAGESQQVKAWNASGSPAWTLGVPGGYASNGPDVSNEKFLFRDREGVVKGCITFAPDGSFWVGDSGNRRLLHYASNRDVIETVQFQNISYSVSVDATDPTRVFCDYLEFAVDYSKPLREGWTLVRNWAGGLPEAYFTFTSGLRQVTTLANGKTYALTANRDRAEREFVELTTNGLRFTNIQLQTDSQGTDVFEFFTPSGAMRRATHFNFTAPPPAGSRIFFEEKPLIGYSAAGDPQWGDYQLLASAPANPEDPVRRCCGLGDPSVPITSSGIIVSFDPSKNNGWHLGGIRPGGTDWLWKASPSLLTNIPLDGLGSFGIGDGVNYPGNSALALGRHVFFGYHGEFWNDTQAGQFMHFYDNGLFIGQFGESGWGHDPFEIIVPGRAGNSAYPSIVQVAGRVHLWVNDESQNGPQRWLIQGTETIREYAGTGQLGQKSPVVVSTVPGLFPTGLSAQAGDRSTRLAWNPVPGAGSYRIYSTDRAEGIPRLLQETNGGNTVLIGNLTNGEKIWFSVSAMVDGSESVASDLVTSTPASPQLIVERAGEFEQPGREPGVYPVLAGNPALGEPAWQGLNPLLGNLSRNNIGSAGYRLFSWDPTTFTDSVNLPGGDTLEAVSGWTVLDYLSLSYRLGTTTGSDRGLSVVSPNAPGILEITPGTGKVYYLTVVLPARFRDDRTHRVTLVAANDPSQSVFYEAMDRPGVQHIYQFRFRGPARLLVEAISGPVSVNAVFLDRANLLGEE